MVYLFAVHPHPNFLFRNYQSHAYFLFFEQRGTASCNLFQAGFQVAEGHFHLLFARRMEVHLLKIEQFGGEMMKVPCAV